MQDMLVRLYDLPEWYMLKEKLSKENIKIRRALAPDKHRIVDFVRNLSNDSAASEVDVAFSRQPLSVFIATHEDRIVAYAAYHATCIDFFGPTAVLKEYRGKGIGKALLLTSLEAMRDEGFAYAIIGGVGPAEFYAHTVGATLIEGSDPGIYRDFYPVFSKENKDVINVSDEK